ncbi:hypothetical protein D3C76_1503820 [compost metagenome]
MICFPIAELTFNVIDFPGIKTVFGIAIIGNAVLLVKSFIFIISIKLFDSSIFIELFIKKFLSLFPNYCYKLV